MKYWPAEPMFVLRCNPDLFSILKIQRPYV
jgi:hypothetical protein